MAVKSLTALLLGLMLAVSLLFPGAIGETRLMVVSDIHYLAPEMYRGSGLFLQALRRGDGKITQYGEELLSGLLSQVRALQPSALIVTGDLTFNGEKDSHERLASWFAAIEAEGVPVWVIPGNHDINNPASRAYGQSVAVQTVSVSAEEFAAIYRDFLLPSEGGGNANLSYHVKISDQLWLALADVSFYQPTAQTLGVFSSGHRAWLEDVLDRAQAAGAEVVTCTHHSLLPHTRFSQESYLMFGHESMAEALRDAGARLNLSGHMHIQHIVQEEGILDAATGAFCIFPHRYALVTLGDDGALTYEAQALSGEYLPRGFLETSRAWFAGITREKARASLTDAEIPQDAAEEMLDYLVQFNLAYFSGAYTTDDPSWKEKEGFRLWQRYGRGTVGAYLDLVMNESPGNQLRRVLPAENAQKY